VQQSRIRRALIERQERHVRDAGETLQRTPDLPASVDAERAGTHLVGDDGDPGSGTHEPAQLGVIAQEA
jgi:hypothetical protein